MLTLHPLKEEVVQEVSLFESKIVSDLAYNYEQLLGLCIISECHCLLGGENQLYVFGR